MQNQKLLYENLVASVNDFTRQLAQVAELTEGFNGGEQRPYFAFALHMLLSSDASKRLGAGWYLLVIQTIFNELDIEFTTFEELDDYIDKFFDLFEDHNIVIDEKVVSDLNVAFEMFEKTLNLETSDADDNY